MITQLILNAALLVIAQIDVRVDCVPRILAGDVLFLKTSFKNTSTEEFVVSVPTKGISYVTTVGYQSIQSPPRHSGMAGTPHAKLSPDKQLDEITLIAPWQEFADAAFNEVHDIRGLKTAEGTERRISICASSELVLYRKMSDGALVPLEAFATAAGKSRPKKLKSLALEILVDGSVLTGNTGNRELYHLRAERTPAFVANNFRRGRDVVDRNCPVGAEDFELPLEWSYYDPQKLNELIEVINPASRLYRVLRLIQLANAWVQTPDGEARKAKEQTMLDYAAQGGPIESEYLIEKTKKLIDSKHREVGDFRPRLSERNGESK